MLGHASKLGRNGSRLKIPRTCVGQSSSGSFSALGGRFGGPFASGTARFLVAFFGFGLSSRASVFTSAGPPGAPSSPPGLSLGLRFRLLLILLEEADDLKVRELSQVRDHTEFRDEPFLVGLADVREPDVRVIAFDVDLELFREPVPHV